MGSRPSLGTLSGVIVGVAILAGVVLACDSRATPDDASSAAATHPGAASSPSVAAIGPSPSVAGRDAPPDALLAAEGGDPVTGQLGSYIWLQTGSDAPWLPGAPLAVGAAEPLTLTLVPAGDIRAWAARYVPADAEGPEGATTLAEGTGDSAFVAPGPGVWTVEVFVEFAAGAGDASYFWRLEVE